MPSQVAAEIPPSHAELPNDPPGDPAHLPRKNPQARSVGAVVQRGTFISRQVNIDEFGQNITGDAGNEPSIAVDPTDPDNIVIGWRQFDTISSDFRQAGWAYSHDGGLSWTFPGTIEPGVFRSDPVLGADLDGNFYYYSLTSVYIDWTCDLFKSTDLGESWSKGVPGFGGDKAWMAIDLTDGVGRGNIYATWGCGFSCCGSNNFTRSTDGGGSFLNPLSVRGCPSWGSMTVGPDGQVYVAGRAPEIARSTNAGDPDAEPVFDLSVEVDLGGSIGIGGYSSPNPSGLLGQAWVASDHSGGAMHGNVYLLASVNPPPPALDHLDVMFARSSDGGAMWSEPIRVNDDLGSSAWQWFGTMSVAPNGRIDVVWNDTRNTGAANLSELFFAFSSDGGQVWSPNVPLSPVFDSYVGWPNGQQKIGDYYHMVSDDAGASLAYAATFNNEQDVYYLRISVDCNGNGILDDQDISGGASTDDNANGVPDECECPPDFTGDGAVNAFDLALMLGAWGSDSGGQTDLDHDGVINASDLRILLSMWGACQ